MGWTLGKGFAAFLHFVFGCWPIGNTLRCSYQALPQGQGRKQ